MNPNTHTPKKKLYLFYIQLPFYVIITLVLLPLLGSSHIVTPVHSVSDFIIISRFLISTFQWIFIRRQTKSDLKNSFFPPFIRFKSENFKCDQIWEPWDGKPKKTIIVCPDQVSAIRIPLSRMKQLTTALSTPPPNNHNNDDKKLKQKPVIFIVANIGISLNKYERFKDAQIFFTVKLSTSRIKPEDSKLHPPSTNRINFSVSWFSSS